MSSTLWHPAYIGVGSNLEDPAAQVRRAIERIGVIGGTQLLAQSRLYRSRAWGRTDQPDFINAVAGVLTQLSSSALLTILQGLESDAGRPALREKWSPRILDLDLLVFGSERSVAADRQLPHPGIAERNFVLFPLRDFAPDLDVPGVGRVSRLAAKVSSVGIEVLQ